MSIIQKTKSKHPKIEIFDTQTGRKETFSPIDPKIVGMYNCGPTVYDNAHIGNLRAYVFADTLRRTLEYAGYKVKQVINITDVGHLVSDEDEGDDKMTKALKREGKPLSIESMKEIGSIYTEKFITDIGKLNIKTPSQFPKASDHIKEDIEIISILEKKGFAYKTSDGMYFDTAKFTGYGRLGNIDIESLKEGARVTSNPEKHNHTDFSLWKFDEKLGWKSPWGKGFPGWHIECSAMSQKYLGQPFDIHTGGIDHIPVHHNNEIAQSEAAYDKPLAKYWMHNSHLMVNDAKISKSAGTSIIISDLEKKGIAPLVYRYWLLTSHYRSLVNFTFEAVSAAGKSYNKLVEQISNWPEGGKVSSEYIDKMASSAFDDLNTPTMIATIWELSKDSSVSPADKRATILDIDKILGLDLLNAAKNIQKSLDLSQIPREVIALADARIQARKDKDWSLADELRDKIAASGYEIRDSGDGYILKKL